MYIPGVANIVADDLSRLEYNQSIISRTINVYLKDKVLANCLRSYVKATSDCPEAIQTYDSTVPTGTITTKHGLHTEYKCNHMLVTDSLIVEKDNCIDETSRQQEVASMRHLFANRTADKMKSTAGLPVSYKLIVRWHFCWRGPILNPRPVLDSSAQTTRGNQLGFCCKT